MYFFHVVHHEIRPYFMQRLMQRLISGAIARAAGATTPIKQLQNKFWIERVEYLETNKSSIKPQQPRARHWLNISLGRAGFSMGATVNSREDRLGLEIYINHQESKNYFAQPKEQSEFIESNLGFSMDWRELPDKNACRILIYKNDSPLIDEAAWNSYFEWLTVTALKLDQVFRPLVKALI